MKNFIPLAVETLGLFGESANNFIRVLGGEQYGGGGELTTDFFFFVMVSAFPKTFRSTRKCCLRYGHR